MPETAPISRNSLEMFEHRGLAEGEGDTDDEEQDRKHPQLRWMLKVRPSTVCTVKSVSDGRAEQADPTPTSPT